MDSLFLGSCSHHTADVALSIQGPFDTSKGIVFATILEIEESTRSFKVVQELFTVECSARVQVGRLILIEDEVLCDEVEAQL